MLLHLLFLLIALGALVLFLLTGIGLTVALNPF